MSRSSKTAPAATWPPPGKCDGCRTEEREGFLDRIAREALGWPELTAAERDMLARHWSQHGRQERVSRLKMMAFEAGFTEMQILWRDPMEFYALPARRLSHQPVTSRRFEFSKPAV